MLRKRDFILFCLAVFFLLLGISSTVVSGSSAAEKVLPSHFATVDSALRASVATSDIDRAARARALREEIAGSELALAEADVESSDDSSPSETSESSAAQQCSNSRTVAISVPPNAQFVEREGARLLVSGAVATGSEAAATDVEVIVQLPARNLPLEGTSCIETDVIGFATDGSPIRNTETGLYGVFGANTLVGYALDGFPIYGTNNTAALDSCGGVVESGQYRYYLSDNRDTVLGCYSGIPVTL